MQKRNSRNIQGCDVSHWQGDVDWCEVKQAGIVFVYIKATEGTSFIDPMFQTNVRGAREAGLTVGAYHFARFTSKQDAVQEARHFFSTVKPHSLDLPYVLDLEIDHGLDAEQLSLNAFLFLETLQTLTHFKPMLYTSTQFAKDHLATSLKDYPLWIAHFDREVPGENGIWDKWTVFQFTNRGVLPGIKGSVDLDEWEAEDFHRLSRSDKGNDQAPHRPKSHVVETTTYKILNGETFWGLESQFGWSHGLLQKLNPRVNPRQLVIGQTIKVPK
jgi:lysozyme